MLRWPSVTLTDHLWLAAHISGIWRDCNAFQGSGRCPEVFHLKCHQLLGLRLHRDAGGSSNCIELGSAHILVWRPQKTFSWKKSYLLLFCKKVLFDMMYPATDPRHHQAYVALARSCLRDEGDNCAGGVVKNVYVRTTVRALVRTCVCTSVWLKLCCARLSQDFPAVTGLSVKLKLGQKGFRTSGWLRKWI